MGRGRFSRIRKLLVTSFRFPQPCSRCPKVLFGHVAVLFQQIHELACLLPVLPRGQKPAQIGQYQGSNKAVMGNLLS